MKSWWMLVKMCRVTYYYNVQLPGHKKAYKCTFVNLSCMTLKLLVFWWDLWKRMNFKHVTQMVRQWICWATQLEQKKVQDWIQRGLLQRPAFHSLYKITLSLSQQIMYWFTNKGGWLLISFRIIWIDIMDDFIYLTREPVMRAPSMIKHLL